MKPSPHSRKADALRTQRNWKETLFEVKRVITVGAVEMSEVGIEGNFRTALHAAFHLIAMDMTTDNATGKGVYQLPGAEEGSTMVVTIETLEPQKEGDAEAGRPPTDL